MHGKWLIILLIGFGLNLLSLLYVTTTNQPTVLGSSDALIGKPGNCAKILGAERCYDRVDYRGYPIHVLKTTYPDDDASKSQPQTNLAGRRGQGILANTLVYSAVVAVPVYLYTTLRKKQ